MDSGGFDGCVSVKESDDASTSLNSNVDASTSLNSNVSCGTVVARCAFPCDCRVVFSCSVVTRIAEVSVATSTVATLVR